MSDTDDAWWYIQDVRTGAIDGFYRQKDIGRKLNALVRKNVQKMDGA